MMSNICLSVRPEHLSRWRQAFPSGTVVPTLSALLRTTGPTTLVWLHTEKLSQVHLDEAIRALQKLSLGVRMVMFSSTPSQQEAFVALNGGVSGYCHAQSTPQMLRQVAMVVNNGGLWIGPELMNRIMAATSRVLAPESDDFPDLHQLTPREIEVAQAVGRGASNKEVAELLEITERTVKAHLGSIFEKLGVRDRLQLLLFLSRKERAS